MRYLKTTLLKLRYPVLIQKAGWISVFGLLYFLLIRPLRAVYSETIIYEALLLSQQSTGTIATAIHSARKVVIMYPSEGGLIEMTHIPQFGFFFLFAMTGLICFQAKRNAYVALVLFQLIVELLVLCLFWFGIHYTMVGFILSDFLMTYLSPLGCLGFLVYASRES